MKKSKFKNETLVLFAILAFSLFLPMNVNAQNGGVDGFFRGGSGGYENRDDGDVSGSITNDSFNAAPLGDGLLIMLSVGAGYTVLRRRRKGAALALILLLGMTQCKKEVKDITPNNNKVEITLNLDQTSKTDVNPETGKVDFVDGDEIIVANNGVYVGKLVCEDGIFSGTIIDPSENDYLHFFHLGNKDVGKLKEGGSATCSVSISDQINALPVISAGCSDELYSENNSTYTAKLHNKCALVKFDVETESQFAAICISGCNNQVDIDFSDDSFSFSAVDGGKIHLSPGSGYKWAVLLPQDELAAGESGSAVSGLYSGTRGSVPRITANEVYGDGISVVVDEPADMEGALSAFFTVNEQGKRVRFSRANLLYDKTADAWMFLNNQYETKEGHQEGVGVDYAEKTTVTLFGWGTSGFNHGAVCSMPYHTSTTKSQYYAYGDPTKNLYDGDGTADWGYNKIVNGGNAYKQWRVMSYEEWHYVLSNAMNEGRFADATVTTSYGTRSGFVLLPEEWTAPYQDCFTTGWDNEDYQTNQYTVNQWNQMEASGAVFFPNSGRRYKKTCIGTQMYLFMWTSSYYNNGDARAVFLMSGEVDLDRTDYRSCGSAVRLVCE